MSIETIKKLIDGTLIDPDGDGERTLSVPTRNVVIENSLSGAEAELVQALDLEPLWRSSVIPILMP